MWECVQPAVESEGAFSGVGSVGMKGGGRPVAWPSRLPGDRALQGKPEGPEQRSVGSRRRVDSASGPSFEPATRWRGVRRFWGDRLGGKPVACEGTWPPEWKRLVGMPALPPANLVTLDFLRTL